ncbi:MAG TPA: hypothetical protein DD473_16030 [Planctomycetaceae bacterium]|nr:hypothetical protein [Planctomycetaceae bacterium]
MFALPIVSEIGHDLKAALIEVKPILTMKAKSSPLFIGKGQHPADSYFISSQFLADGMNILFPPKQI